MASTAQSAHSVLALREKVTARATTYHHLTALPPDDEIHKGTGAGMLLLQLDGLEARVEEVVGGLLGYVVKHGEDDVPHFHVVWFFLSHGCVIAAQIDDMSVVGRRGGRKLLEVITELETCGIWLSTPVVIVFAQVVGHCVFNVDGVEESV
jgi:hypothetical protein